MVLYAPVPLLPPRLLDNREPQPAALAPPGLQDPDSGISARPPAKRCPCCSTTPPLSLRSSRPCSAELGALGLGRQPPGRRADRYPAAFKESTCSATLRLMNLLTARDTKGDIAAGILEMRIYLFGAFQMLCTTLGLQVVPNGQRWHQE